MTSMISLIIVLLAACAYSAPVVPDFQNATSIMEVENVTLFTREQTSEDKRGKVTVGLSSSSEESNETTDKPSERDFEDSSVVTEDSFTTEHTKRDIDTDGNEPSAVTDDERSFTEDSFTAENTKRGIEVESFETSTADETSVPPASEVEKVKRSLDNQPWLAGSSKMTVQKRSIEIVESSTDVDETSTGEDSAISSTSEMNNMKRNFEEDSLTTEASEAFNRRAIGSVESIEAGESSTIITIKVQPESTTDEQPSSSTAEYVETTEVIREASSSTSDYETTVVPVEESTTVVSPVPSETTAKILAIIPGTISRTQFVVPPVEQMQLNQGQNETITETKQPNY